MKGNTEGRSGLNSEVVMATETNYEQECANQRNRTTVDGF
jgi:hypothetical protein